jgi:hypothetical protein
MKHTVEQRFFGITCFRRTSDGSPGPDYARIFGHPCQHVFRKGGFGRGARFLFMPTVIGCGSTAEGMLVRPRVEAVAATFAAERRLRDRGLALDTFRVIDNLFPPDTESNQLRELPKEARSAASSLGFYLSRVQTVEEWQAVLTAAHGGFKDVSNLPTD